MIEYDYNPKVPGVYAKVLSEIVQTQVQGHIVEGLCNRKISLEFIPRESKGWYGSGDITITELQDINQPNPDFEAIKSGTIRVWVKKQKMSKNIADWIKGSPYRSIFHYHIDSSFKKFNEYDSTCIFNDNPLDLLVLESVETYCKVIGGKDRIQDLEKAMLSFMQKGFMYKDSNTAFNTGINRFASRYRYLQDLNKNNEVKK